MAFEEYYKAGLGLGQAPIVGMQSASDLYGAGLKQQQLLAEITRQANLQKTLDQIGLNTAGSGVTTHVMKAQETPVMPDVPTPSTEVASSSIADNVASLGGEVPSMGLGLSTPKSVGLPETPISISPEVANMEIPDSTVAQEQPVSGLATSEQPINMAGLATPNALQTSSFNESDISRLEAIANAHDLYGDANTASAYRTKAEEMRSHNENIANIGYNNKVKALLGAIENAYNNGDSESYTALTAEASKIQGLEGAAEIWSKTKVTGKGEAIAQNLTMDDSIREAMLVMAPDDMTRRNIESIPNGTRMDVTTTGKVISNIDLIGEDETWKGGTTSKSTSGVSPLSQDALDLEAIKYLGTGTISSSGRQNSENINRIKERAAEMLSDAGIDPQEAPSLFSTVKAKSSALTNLERQKANIANFEATAQKNLEVANVAMKKIDPSQIRALAKLENAFDAQIADPNLAAARAALRTASNEVARVVSGGVGVTPETERTEFNKLLESAMSIKQVTAIIDIYKKDMANRISSIDESINKTNSEIKNFVSPVKFIIPGNSKPFYVPITKIKYFKQENPTAQRVK